MNFIKKVCEKRGSWALVIPSEHTKILEFNQHQKSDKKPSTIDADLAPFVKKVDRFKNNPEKSFITKLGEHIPCEYSMYLIWRFDGKENRAWCIQWWRLDEKRVLKKAKNGDNYLWKELNGTVSKGTAAVVWKDKNLLHL